MSDLTRSLELQANPPAGPPHLGLTELVGFIAVVFLGALSGAFGAPGEWYEQLIKPAWNPPPWLFGPVWTVLYLTIGISAWWVVRVAGWRRSRGALVAWATQMSLNIAWTPVFFGLHQMAVALGVIVAMWFAIVATIVAFMRLHRAAGLLLLPYLGWVGFATVLNGTLWWLNR